MKILLVEDERKIADNIKKGLEQEKMIVDMCYDGGSGYDFAISEKYDVIILDIMLPGINGLEILKSIRKEKINTPILMLTAKSYLEDKVKGLENGADDYLPKPFDFEELVARIKALGRRNTNFTSNILECEDLKMDTNLYLVERKGNQIDLSKKEFELLEYLLKNKGRVCKKEQIIQQVWGFEEDVLPNTVEVYIGYLRNKIEKPFNNSNKIIKTVRGFGYKIC